MLLVDIPCLPGKWRREAEDVAGLADSNGQESSFSGDGVEVLVDAAQRLGSAGRKMPVHDTDKGQEQCCQLQRELVDAGPEVGRQNVALHDGADAA